MTRARVEARAVVGRPSRVRASGSPRSSTRTAAAPACLAAFWSASRQQKYAAASTLERVPADRRLRDLRRVLPAPPIAARRAAGHARAPRAAAGRCRGRAGPASSTASAAAASCAVEQRLGALGRARPASVVREAQVHRQRDQVLLGAVVDVPLEAPALGVLGVDQALAGDPQLLGPRGQLGRPELELGAQPGAAQHQPGLGRRARRTAAPRPAVRGYPAAPGTTRTPSSSPPWRTATRRTPGDPSGEADLSRAALGGQVAARSRSALADRHPHLRRHGAGAVGEDPGHPLRQLLRRVAAGDASRRTAAARRTARAGRRARSGTRAPRGGSAPGRTPSATTAVASTERPRLGDDVCPIRAPAAEHDHDVGQHDEGEQPGDDEAAREQLASGAPAPPDQRGHSCSLLAPAAAGEGVPRTPGVGLAAPCQPPAAARPAPRRAAPSPIGAAARIPVCLVVRRSPRTATNLRRNQQCPSPPLATPPTTTTTGDRTAARADGVSKLYGSGDATVAALDNVSVGLDRGRFTAIMGPSGSGKSTLLHMLAGLDRPTSGEVYLGDTEITSLNDKALTAAASRPDRLHLPVVQPAPDDDGGREHRAADADRRAQAGRPLGGLDRRDRRPHRSARPPPDAAVRWPAAARGRGPGARLAPEIVFADEPTGALDSRSGTELLRFLRTAVDELGQTVVMVTHDADRGRLRRPGHLPRRRPHRRRDARADRRAASSTT